MPLFMCYVVTCVWHVAVVGVGACGAGRVRRPRLAVPHGAPRLLLLGAAVRGGRRWRRLRALAASPVADQEAVCDAEAAANPLEAHDVAGVEALLLDVPAPALGEHVALAAGPVRVPEPPRLAGLVLEGHQQAFLAATTAAEREVPLCVLLGDHQPVELAHVTGREGLLEQLLPLVLVVVVQVVGVHGHPPRPRRRGVPMGEVRVHGHCCPWSRWTLDS
jgi:hypothetical protein